ncbi:MAG: hypothetical protein IJ733_17100 [Lachnospiraceae bacterium]|nr:hypothetical protein [Lachnospiraceae bacterium]
MRYYYEAEEQERRRRAKENLYEIQPKRKKQDSLVIEEDTVYEIDEVCMNRREWK